MAKNCVSADMAVSTTELAIVLGLTARRIQQLSQDGIITPVRRGEYPLGDSVQRYIGFLSRETVDEEERKLSRAKQSAEVTLKASKAKIAKLEADELEGKMHCSEDVAAMTEDLIYTIRSALMALPGRLAVDVSSAKSPAEASEIIRREIALLMKELAGYRYNPKRYEERVRGKRVVTS